MNWQAVETLPTKTTINNKQQLKHVSQNC